MELVQSYHQLNSFISEIRSLRKGFISPWVITGPELLLPDGIRSKQFRMWGHTGRHRNGAVLFHTCLLYTSTVRKIIRIHLKSLCAPFSEITEERYFDYMDVLPPIRHTRNFFFLGLFRDILSNINIISINIDIYET